jgi:hypothetical protein
MPLLLGPGNSGIILDHGGFKKNWNSLSTLWLVLVVNVEGQSFRKRQNSGLQVSATWKDSFAVGQRPANQLDHG